MHEFFFRVWKASILRFSFCLAEWSFSLSLSLLANERAFLVNILRVLLPVQSCFFFIYIKMCGPKRFTYFELRYTVSLVLFQRKSVFLAIYKDPCTEIPMFSWFQTFIKLEIILSRANSQSSIYRLLIGSGHLLLVIFCWSNTNISWWDLAVNVHLFLLHVVMLPYLYVQDKVCIE